MNNFVVTMIDGWRCEERYPGTDWATRYASKGNVEWSADSDGLTVRELGSGYSGFCGTYGVTANVSMWLAAVVR